DPSGPAPRLFPHRPHVFQVRQQRFGVDVAFAAKYFVAVDCELIEKITGFVPRLGRKLRQDRLQILHLVRRHLEVVMQTDESRKLIHTLMINLSGMQGEARRLRQKQVRSPTDELCDLFIAANKCFCHSEQSEESGSSYGTTAQSIVGFMPC